MKEVNELKARLSKLEGESTPIAATINDKPTPVSPASVDGGGKSQTSSSSERIETNNGVPTTPASTPKKATTTSSISSSNNKVYDDEDEVNRSMRLFNPMITVKVEDNKVESKQDETSKAMEASATKQPTSLFGQTTITTKDKINYEKEYKMAEAYGKFLTYLVYLDQKIVLCSGIARIWAARSKVTKELDDYIGFFDLSTKDKVNEVLKKFIDKSPEYWWEKIEEVSSEPTKSK